MKYVLEVLFPYIFLLYVFDCVTFVKARHMLLTSVFGRKFDLKRSGVRLAGLFPISQAIKSHNLPIVYTVDGIHAVFDESSSNKRIDRAGDFTFVKFEDLESIEDDGKDIKFTNTCAIQTPSSQCARFHAGFIKKIKKLSPVGRKEQIEAFLSDSHDLEAIKKTATSNSKSFTIIKILSSNLYVLVFFILPAFLYSDLDRYFNLGAFVICIFIIYLLLLSVSSLKLKKLYPSEKDFRYHTLLSLIFAPVNSVHVLSYLTKDLYLRFDYLAVAAYFLPRDSFKELARKEHVLIDHFENEIGMQGWLKFWEFKKKLLLGLLDECQIPLQEILAPPEKQDQNANYFCPFCMAEYLQKRPECIDCEMALKEFDNEKKCIPVSAVSALNMIAKTPSPYGR